GTTADHIARAALESMCGQSCELLVALKIDAGVDLSDVKVDGGASVNNHLMQFQADLLNAVIRRPVVPETTALGAAFLAGLAVNFWQDTAELTQRWKLDQQFTPNMPEQRREAYSRQWQRAIERATGWIQP
ncbi:MAG: FGGY-family carbohydrate kinase, partial [Planctomycetales bacterium]